MSSPLSALLAVTITDEAESSKASLFAKRHALTLVNDTKHCAQPYVLEFREGAYRLLQTGKGSPGPVSASFLQGKVAHRRQFGGGQGQLIAKAVGVQPGIRPKVLDVTAGLGRDAFVLATLGCEITLIERSPVVYELLASALREAQYSEVAEVVARMQLHNASAASYLQTGAGHLADVIYLDPMYPPREKSALVKKEMRAFHALVGADEDAGALLPLAMERARCRVVVKRPRLGEPLGELEPSLQLSGKSARYDIYTMQSLNVLKHASSV